MSYIPEIASASVVLVGSFAPRRYSAHWLLQNNLIGEVDFEQITTNENYVCTQHLSQMECTAFHLQVTSTRIQIICGAVLTPVVNDLAKSLLSLMGDAVVDSAGINFFSHFQIQSEDEYHRIGDVLAPKPIWQKLFPDPGWSAGLADLAVKISFAPRGETDATGNGFTVRVQPSAKIEKNGVMLTFNHHVNFPKESSQVEAALEFFDQAWDHGLGHSKVVFNDLLESTKSY